MKIQNTKLDKNTGEILEVRTPHLHSNGKYRVEIYVSLEEMEQFVASPDRDTSVRMKGNDTKSPVIVKPDALNSTS